MSGVSGESYQIQEKTESQPDSTTRLEQGQDAQQDKMPRGHCTLARPLETDQIDTKSAPLNVRPFCPRHSRIHTFQHLAQVRFESIAVLFPLDGADTGNRLFQMQTA